MQKKKLLLTLGCLLLAGVFLLPGVCFAKPIVMKGMTVFEPTRDNVIPLTWLAKKLEEKSGGEIKINILGGPEIIPIPEQPQALMDGTIDILLTFPTTFEDKVPQTIAMVASKRMPWEERENGFFDWMNGKCEKFNMRFICRSESESGSFYYSNKKITDMEGFKNQKVGTSPMWVAFVKKIDAVPILIDEPDLYTAMSRKTIDAQITPAEAQLALGLYEVTKYITGPAFYKASNMMILINLDTWKKFTPEQQELILKCGEEIEYECVEWFRTNQEKNVNKLVANKMEIVEFSPEEAEKYIDAANEAMWDKAKEKNTPEDYEALRKFLD